MILDTSSGRRDGRKHDQVATRGQMLVGLLGNEELAASVDVEDAIEFFGGYLANMIKRFDTRIGDDDVELAKVARFLQAWICLP